MKRLFHSLCISIFLLPLAACQVDPAYDLDNLDPEITVLKTGLRYPLGWTKKMRLDALFNLAGLSIPTQMETVSGEDFDKMLDVNVKGTLLASKHYARHCVETGGLILNIGSMAARRANGNAPLYCTAKSAVNMLSAGMQLQLGGKDIRVTTLNPGGADTPFWGTRKVDRGTLMQADDVVDVMLFVLDHPRMVFYSLDFESAARIHS